MKYFLVLFFISSLSAQDQVQSKGEQSFKIHCAACHLLANAVVGPSLVTVAETYPAGQKEAFITWAKTPGKKNAKMIQMPSMAHVPDVELSAIHDYLLAVTKGVKNKKNKEVFPKFKEPKRALPYVARASMPDSSPASVGIVLENGLTVCWDTEACRFRYAYVGDKTALFSMWRPAKLPNKPYYRESAEQLFVGMGQPKFLGYRLVEKDPEFRFKIGSVEFRELISAGNRPKELTRRFTIQNLTEDIVLDLSGEGTALLNVDKGSLQDGKLTLSADEAKSFTLTLTK